MQLLTMTNETLQNTPNLWLREQLAQHPNFIFSRDARADNQAFMQDFCRTPQFLLNGKSHFSIFPKDKTEVEQTLITLFTHEQIEEIKKHYSQTPSYFASCPFLRFSESQTGASRYQIQPQEHTLNLYAQNGKVHLNVHAPFYSIFTFDRDGAPRRAANLTGNVIITFELTPEGFKLVALSTTSLFLSALLNTKFDTKKIIATEKDIDSFAEQQKRKPQPEKLLHTFFTPNTSEHIASSSGKESSSFNRTTSSPVKSH